MTSLRNAPFITQNQQQDATENEMMGHLESSWYFLGELPYRRLTLYDNVEWSYIPETFTSQAYQDLQQNQVKQEHDNTRSNRSEGLLRGNGLAAYPPEYLASVELLDVDLRAYLETATTTHVAGCPHGGPLAIVSVPKHAVSVDGNQNFAKTFIRVVTSSGRLLSLILFPPPSLNSPSSHDGINTTGRYTSHDLFQIGFANSTTLVVILRDSTCLTYKVSGEVLLPPFTIIEKNPNRTLSEEVIGCHIFDGGAAILTSTMSCALVELLDHFDDPSYVEQTSHATRKVAGKTPWGARSFSKDDNQYELSKIKKNMSSPSLPSFALVTVLPTSRFAHQQGFHFLALAVLPRKHTSDGHPEIFLSTSDNSVVIANSRNLDLLDIECRSRMQSPIVQMKFAPNGRFVVCFTANCMMTVISTNFETKVLDFDTSEGSTTEPTQIEWCGEDSVVMHWKNTGVLMVGPYGDWLRFPYGEEHEVDGQVFLVGEVDCCRIVTHSGRYDIIQRVPPATASLLRIGSIEPGAMLLDASDAFLSGSPSADEAARSLAKSGLLMEAVGICIDAACKEFDVYTQKRLMRAASYGLQFSFKVGYGPFEGNRHNAGNGTQEKQGAENIGDDDVGANRRIDFANEPSEAARTFVSCSKKIRILNALRRRHVGFSLTSNEYDEITPTGVIARLAGMGFPSLASELSTYLNLDYKVQATTRACCAAAFLASDSTASDQQAVEKVIQILQDVSWPRSVAAALNRGGYAAVALAAARLGRPSVATMILRLERSPVEKVPALVSIGNFADAATVAASAREGDLMFETLLDFEQECYVSAQDEAKARMKFISNVVQKFPRESYDLLKVYYSNLQDIKPVNHLFFVGQHFNESGNHMAKQALKMDRSNQDFLVTLREASRIYGLGKECTFQKSCTDDYIDLSNEQERLRQTYGIGATPRLSCVTETVKALLVYAAVDPSVSQRLINESDRLAKKFRLPEKRYWSLKVQSFSKTGQWQALRDLADSRAKSPIGFKPFALAMIRGEQPVKEIMRFMERIVEKEDRFYLFCKAKLWRRALEEAVALKDTSKLMEIVSSCNDPEIIAECERIALAMR